MYLFSKFKIIGEVINIEFKKYALKNNCKDWHCTQDSSSYLTVKYKY